jgi:hypothetical protein
LAGRVNPESAHSLFARRFRARFDESGPSSQPERNMNDDRRHEVRVISNVLTLL